MYVFPASHYVAGPERMAKAITSIEDELRERLRTLGLQGKLLEAQRLRMRTTLRPGNDGADGLLQWRRELLAPY